MKIKYFYFAVSIALLVMTSCDTRKADTLELRQNAEQQLQRITEKITGSEINDDLGTFLQYYHAEAISMPEYQLTLQGQQEIGNFYRDIFARQKIKTFQRHAHEFIHLGRIIVEIGTFKKEYTGTTSDTLLTQNGKYWNIWESQADGDFKIKGEAFGYFHAVDDPETLIVQMGNAQPDESEIQLQKEIPFELKAYNALMEKGVRKRDAILRSEFFTNDGSFFPFADTTVTGVNEIKPYLTEYSSRGTVTIDSIMCYTYHFENLNDHVLEYDMFKVKWTVPGFSGRTEGKGIRIWQRQEDHSLKIYREIGTHNLIN